MGISHIATDHDYYRILAKQAECGSRLGVPKHSGHKRLETEPTGFSENNQNNGNPRHGSICFPSDLPGSSLHGMASRPREQGYRCLPTKMGTPLPIYAFPPFALINRTLSKVNKDQVRIILVTPTWQTQPWYATLLHMS